MPGEVERKIPSMISQLNSPATRLNGSIHEFDIITEQLKTPESDVSRDGANYVHFL